MKLKDIADMNDYLENRCYCPYEIYDMTGFFMNSSIQRLNAQFSCLVQRVLFTEFL